MSSSTPGLKCADQFAALSSSVAGTAPPFSSLLVVELPLPWPKDIGTDPRLVDIAEVCQDTGHRLQTVVPAMTATKLRALRFTRTATAVTGFARVERSFEPHELQTETIALLREAGSDDRDPAEVSDVLVCAHGIRDRCCGSAGTRLFLGAEESAPPGIHLWRTSHLGGHRFAPTAMTLPDGRAWASLDSATLVAIATRAVDPSAVAHLDRGSSLFADRWHQVADSAVLAHLDDWSWTRTDRTMTTRPGPLDGTRVVDVADDADRRWVVTVETVRRLPIPLCGSELADAVKFDDELRATEVHRLF